MKKFLKSGITAKICQTLGGISRKQIPKEEQVIKILDYLYLLQTQFRKTRMQQPPTLFKDSFLGLSVLFHPIIPLLVPLFLYIIPLTFGKWKLTSSDLFLLETWSWRGGKRKSSEFWRLKFVCLGLVFSFPILLAKKKKKFYMKGIPTMRWDSRRGPGRKQQPNC